MSKVRISFRKGTVVGAILALALIPNLTAFSAIGSSPAGVISDPDLSSEARTIGTFVDDLHAFDKSFATLNQRATLTTSEINAVQRSNDDLKRRLSNLQNAFKETIRKLKAAGLWDKLDATVLAKVKDPKFQAVARQESFKAALEDLAANTAGSGNEIAAPFDLLRKKVSARLIDPLSDQDPSVAGWRTVRASYQPYSVPVKVSFKCRVAWLRVGLQRAFSDTLQATDEATNAVGCYCDGDKLDCQFTPY
jgi:hypothetical protein